jgi:VWFA-related protein
MTMWRHLPDHSNKLCRAVPAAFALVCLTTAQSIPSDEIRSRTVPYAPPAQPILHAEVRVVEVPVVVRDGHRRTVGGLTRDDFKIYDNGKKQTITAFSVESSTQRDGAVDAAGSKTRPLPRFLALCFDDLHLPPTALARVKEAADQFVKTSLAPGDQAAVVTTSHSNRSVFTSDVPALVEEIAKVTSVPQPASYTSQSCIRITPYEAYQLVEHMDPGDALLHAKVAECAACYHAPCHEGMIASTAKAVWADNRIGTEATLGEIVALVDGMAKLPGQRMILLTSTGFITDTLQADVDKLMDKARHAEVVINVLDARGLYSAGTPYDGMGALAYGTGGAFYHNQNELDEGFRELGTAPDTIYLLSFTPSSVPDAHFHKLKVQVESKYAVQARQGYMALASSAANDSTATKLDSELMGSDAIADLPVSFTWQQLPGPSAITMIAKLDISHLYFKPWQGRRTQKVTIAAVVLDSHGSFVAGKRSELELSFRDATFSQLSKTGLPVAMSIKAPPGSYSVRAVAQDAMESKLAAISDVVQIK